MPACVVLLSAGVDFTLGSRSMVTNEGSGPMFDLAELVGMCSFYAPPESYLDPGVSPLFGNFAGSSRCSGCTVFREFARPSVIGDRHLSDAVREAECGSAHCCDTDRESE
jgi:hypothetical protein